MNPTTRFELNPAWDRRRAEDGKNYGIRGCTLYFSYIGEKGAASALYSTNWFLNPDDAHRIEGPRISRVVIHSRTQRGVDCVHSDDCVLIKPHCWWRGLSVDQERPFERILIEQGSDGVYEALGKLYGEWLER